MPGGAHNPAGAWPFPRSAGRAERAFSLVEMIVVMVLVAIALMAAIHTLSSIRRSSADQRYQAAASQIWRGVGAWRQDNKGALPPASLLAAGPARFRNVAGAPYIKQWPEDPMTDKPLAPRPGSGAAPPATGPSGQVLYAANGNAGWVAAYGFDGRPVFIRAVGPGTTTVAPVG